MTAKTFSGFTAEMIPHEDRKGFNCFISKGRYSASLACASDMGTLTDDSDEIAIPPRVLDAIEEWALQQGY